MKGIVEDSPRPTARTIGIVYLLYFVTALIGGFLLKGLVVATDPVVTVNNLLAHASLYRSGFALGLLGNGVYLALTALFYGLLSPVNRSVSLVAAFFGLVGCTVQIFAGILQLAPLTILEPSQLLSGFNVVQLRQAALLSLRLYAQTFQISFVMFALFEVVLGYLIYKSTYLPRFLGVLWVIAGVGGLTFLWPPLATALWPYALLPVGLAEIGLMLWLIVRGVDLPKWREKARVELERE